MQCKSIEESMIEAVHMCVYGLHDLVKRKGAEWVLYHSGKIFMPKEEDPMIFGDIVKQILNTDIDESYRHWMSKSLSEINILILGCDRMVKIYGIENKQSTLNRGFIEQVKSMFPHVSYMKQPVMLMSQDVITFVEKDAPKPKLPCENLVIKNK